MIRELIEEPQRQSDDPLDHQRSRRRHTKAQSIQANVPLSEVSISSTSVRRTAALQVKLIKHSHIEAIGAGMRDQARTHKRASTQSWAWVLAFLILVVEETLEPEELVASSAAI